MRKMVNKYVAILLLAAFSVIIVFASLKTNHASSSNPTAEVSLKPADEDKNSKVFTRIPLLFMGSYALIQKYANKSSER